MNIGVHQTHCCKKHGCKYGDENCPVELGTIEPENELQCEDCYYKDICYECGSDNIGPRTETPKDFEEKQFQNLMKRTVVTLEAIQHRIEHPKNTAEYLRDMERAKKFVNLFKEVYKRKGEEL